MSEVAVEFVGEDRKTRGNWQGRFGKLATGLPGQTPEILISDPAIILQAPYLTGDLPAPRAPGERKRLVVAHVWEPGTQDERAPQQLGGAGRSSAHWSGPYREACDFVTAVEFTDSKPRRVSLYFVDWNRFEEGGEHEIRQRVEVAADVEGALSDCQEIRRFGDGIYLTWLVSGAATFRVVNHNGRGGGRLFGIFVD